MPPTYVPSIGPRDARVMIVGEAPGKDEEKAGTPFVGQSGQILREALARNGIIPSSCYITNVCHYRPENNDISKFIKFKKSGPDYNDYIKDGLAELYADIDSIRPDIIVPLGNVALWAVSQRRQITKRRGSVLGYDPPRSLVSNLDDSYRPKVIPTIHPAAILRQYTLRPVFEFDLKKIKRAIYDPDSLTQTARTFYLAAEEVETHDGRQIENSTIVYANEALTNELAAKLRDAKEISVDIETPSGRLYCVGFAPDPSWCLVLRSDTAWKLALIEELLDTDIPKIFQNGLFDTSFLLRHENLKVRNYAYDTMYAQHAIYPESAGGAVDEHKKKKNNPGMRLGLDFLTSIYTNEPYFKDEGKNQDLTITGDVVEYLSYNAKDCCVTLEVAIAQRENGLNDPDIRSAFELTMQQTPVIIDMMVHGMRFDTKGLAETREFYETEKVRLHKTLDSMALNKLLALSQKEKDPEQQKEYLLAATLIAGRMKLEQPGVQVASPKELGILLYDTLGFKEKKKKNTKGKMVRTTDEESIKELYGETRDPMLLTLIDIRRADKLLANYLSIKLDPAGYTYYSVNPVGTKTSRHSVSKDIHGYGLNMTTIPRPKKGKPNIRNLIIPADGKLLGYFDLAQVEDRIVSYLAGVEKKIHAFENNIDAHTLTASLIFGKPMEEIDKKGVERYLGKQANHAFNYGEGPVTFTKKINKNADETGVWVDFALSKGIREGHLAAYPEIKDFWNYVEKNLRKRRLLQNPFSRKRFFFDRLNDTTIRDGYSWIPQSTAPDIINRGMIAVYHALKNHGVRILLQVHDALLIELPEDGAEEIGKEILRLMTIPVTIRSIHDDAPKIITIPTDYKLGTSWGAVE